MGSRTGNALRAFQERERLPVTRRLDAATRAALMLHEPPYTHYSVTSLDLSRLGVVPEGWLAKSQVPRLEYETIDELVGERFQTDPDLLRQMNQGIVWENVPANTRLLVPGIEPISDEKKAAWARVRLSDYTLQVFDEGTNLMAHFPCSIARSADKRPVGALKIASLIRDPDYTWDQANFPLSAEAQVAQRLRIPPGPNNPVGAVWIGLDRPGYGIHGSPHPERVGVAESLGCFRLANWNAERMLRLSWIGMPVLVEP
jgi:lipoprotein-anchoring transpeptidase ErfK/SrfK